MNKNMGNFINSSKQLLIPTTELIQNIQKELMTNFMGLLQGTHNTFSSQVDLKEKEFFKHEPDYQIVLDVIEGIKENGSVTKEFITQNFQDEVRFSKISRAMACFVCSGIGDALGTHIEFQEVKYDREPLITGFNKAQFPQFNEKNRRCNLGEFSDDTSMALCLADNLLFNDFQFNSIDLQIKFINWWYFSYNNCLVPRRRSFGLGGNINTSMQNFIRQSRNILNDIPYENISPTYFLKVLNENIDFNKNKDNTNGNGSLMRLAPVPIAFASDESLFYQGLDFAEMQSRVTHTGEEAAEACRLLAYLIMKLINYNRKYSEYDVNDNDNNEIKKAIDECLSDFPQSNNYSVNCIKDSKQESRENFELGINNHEYYREVNLTLQDRDWNWREKDYRYSPTRQYANPGYVGSYALDALTMALNISYHSTSAKQAIIKAANMGGDSDTVAAIVGQIVGAYYGLNKDILELYEGVKCFDEGKLAYMAYKLFTCEKKKY